MQVTVQAPERPLRVLQIAGTAVGGDWFYHQVTGLARRSHVVCAVVPRQGPLADRLRAAGIRVEVIPFGMSRRLRHLPSCAAAEIRLVRLVRAFRPDVIHSHLILAILASRVASLGYPHALRVAQMPGMTCLYPSAVRWLDKRTVFRDHLILGTCRAIADEYRALGARSVAVSYYGCDVRQFDPHTSGAAFRREFGVPGGVPAIGIVAYLYRCRLPGFEHIGLKGHEVFLDAARLILEQIPDAQLFVIGDSLVDSGEYRHELQKRATALGIERSVHFTGRRADIASIVAGLDVVVNPSLAESACYTMIEALLMEKGVVASDIGGLPDTIQNGETGLLVPRGDSQALAAAVIKLITNPSARRAMGRLGRERCLRRFDIEATVSQVEALYWEKLKEHGRGGRDCKGEPPGIPGKLVPGDAEQQAAQRDWKRGRDA
jgi:glycosyltransferase involved in cell wall biosynthesis